MQGSLGVGRSTIAYQVVEERVPGALCVSAKSAQSQDVLEREVRQVLATQYWWIGTECVDLPLTERWRFRYGTYATEIYNFAAPLSQELRALLLRGLSLFCMALREPSFWKLQSVQFLPVGPMNGKSGRPMRGREVIDERRFVVYPPALHAGPCCDAPVARELSWTAIHEATHVMLERLLQTEWSKVFGWRPCKDYQDYDVRLPGGGVADAFLLEPELCPTVYASYQPDDDLADSVGAFLLAPELLSPGRRNFLEKHLRQPATEVRGTLLRQETVLPGLPVEVKVYVQTGAIFRGLAPVPHATDPSTRQPIAYANFIRGVRDGSIRPTP